MTKPFRRLANELDPFLRERGFLRKGLVWNRRRPPFVDVVDIQVVDWDGTCYVNLGVAHDGTYATIWERPLPDFVQEPEAIVRSRLGRLVADRDMSWHPSNPGSAVEITQMLALHGLPFLERIRTLADTADFLRGRPGRTWVERVTDAVVLNYAGDTAGGCAILMKLAGSSSDLRLERLMVDLGCRAPDVSRDVD